uniref:PAN domain protein n=1 Tax=Elaeophora elaphi TaxID=1147741 RepID=A0A0R3S175_9BILA
MTIIVSLIVSTLNTVKQVLMFYSSFIPFLILPINDARVVWLTKGDIFALKRCFEQYIGQRLSDLSPYHSEWRMKTSEECLLFCALSSSRCRSTVHDTFQHICHYYLNDGQQHTQLARSMVYFRVIDKKCLDQFLNGSNFTLLDSESTILDTSSSSTLKHNATMGTIELQRPAVAHANPLIHVPLGGRAITPTPYFDYFDNQYKSKKHEKFDQSNHTVANAALITSDNVQQRQHYHTAVASSGITTSTSTSSPTAFSEMLSERDQIYDESAQLASVSELSSPTFPVFLSRHEKDFINSAFQRPKSLQSNHQAYSSDGASFFTGNFVNHPVLGANFGIESQKYGVDSNKLLKEIPEDIRRSPIKTSLSNAEKLNEVKGINEMITLLGSEKFIMDRLIPIPAIKSISITPSKQNNRMEKFLPTEICGTNGREVWLVVANAILETDELQKKTSAGSYKSCRAKCNLITRSGKECISFTYDEVKRHCVTYSNNDIVVSSLAFLPTPVSDISVRTAIKFCYPENLIVLEKCPDFIAFLDYTTNMEPREIFDNIPRGHQGLHACIELCVLAPHFHCKVCFIYGALP